MAFVGISLWGKCLTEQNFEEDWPLLDALKKNNVTLVPLKDERLTHYVAMDHSQLNFEKYAAKLSLQKRALFVFEPEAVLPMQHQIKVRKKYSRTWVGSPRQILRAEDSWMIMGSLPSPERRKPVAPENINSVALINENKFSFVPGNLYKFRTDVLRSLSSAGIPVELAGKNWQKGLLWSVKQQFLALGFLVKNRQRFQLSNVQLPLRPSKLIHLHGRVPNAIEFLKGHDFAIVIENDPNYISEKLMNAILAGCIPLFVGPPLGEYNLPNDLAIQVNGLRRSFEMAIRHTSEEQKARIRDAGAKWLSQQGSDSLWVNDNSLRAMAKAISEFAEGS